MLHAALVVEQRRNPRVQLHLPVRLRWLGPLGSHLEIRETLDVSRGGILFYRPDVCLEGARVWITFPFDPAAATQMETPARVIRVKTTPTGGHLISVRLEAPSRRPALAVADELRASPRVPVVMPIEVRGGDSPWPEEAMTLNVSACGILFETSWLYSSGDTVRARLHFGEWRRAGEFPARVVRVETQPDTAEQRVAISWDLPALS